MLDDAPKFMEAPVNVERALHQVQLINRVQEEQVDVDAYDESDDSESGEVGEEGPVRFDSNTDRSPIEAKIQQAVTRDLFQGHQNDESFLRRV